MFEYSMPSTLKVEFAEQYAPPVSILHESISTMCPLAAVVLLCKLWPGAAP